MDWLTAEIFREFKSGWVLEEIGNGFRRYFKADNPRTHKLIINPEKGGDDELTFYPTLDGFIEYLDGACNAVYTTSVNLRVGDYGWIEGKLLPYNWWRSFLRFDVTEIPDDATITSATFYAYLYNGDYIDPGYRSCHLTHVSDIGSTLECADWNVSVLHDYGEFCPVAGPLSPIWGWKSKDVTTSITPTSTFVSYRLASTIEDGGPTTYAYWDFCSTEYDGYDPYLVVVYTVPPPPVVWGGSALPQLEMAKAILGL